MEKTLPPEKTFGINPSPVFSVVLTSKGNPIKFMSEFYKKTYTQKIINSNEKHRFYRK
jgi:hypothetical protein